MFRWVLHFTLNFVTTRTQTLVNNIFTYLFLLHVYVIKEILRPTHASSGFYSPSPHDPYPPLIKQKGSVNINKIQYYAEQWLVLLKYIFLNGRLVEPFRRKSKLNFVSWLRVHTNINIVWPVAVWRTSSLWTRRAIQFVSNNVKKRTSIYNWNEISMSYSSCKKGSLPYKFETKNFNRLLKYF